MKNPKFKILMIGPLPPSVGGMASYILNLKKELEMDDDVTVVSISPYVINFIDLKSIIQKILKILINISNLLRIIKRGDANIVHIHTSSSFSFLENLIYTEVIRIFSNVPIILHIHAGDFNEFLNQNIILKKAITKVLNRYDMIIVLSSYWERILKNELGDEAKITIIHNAASNSIFQLDQCFCRRKLGLPSNKKIILSLGKLTEKKGFKYLIESIYILKKEGTDVLCFIAGDGSLRIQLSTLIKDLNLDNNVKLLGIITENINIWINSADLVVLPSLSEGVPIVMLEAFNCGKPFVGTRVGGIPDIMNSSDYGSLVEPANSVELANALRIALNNNWSAEKIVSYASIFSFAIISRKIINTYSKVLV